MKFTSNRDVAVSVENLSLALNFYENVLGFKPIKLESNKRLYDTGNFNLYLEEGKRHSPILSFTVKNLDKAKDYLTKNGCKIIVERKNSLYFCDPNKVVWDIIQYEP